MDTRPHDPFTPLPQRIVVVGSSGAGKSTLAKTLARTLGLRHTELDALYWEPGWVGADSDVFLKRVDAVTSGERWTMDGNFTQARGLVWGRADTVIWLDYARPLILARLLKRTIRRAALREPLWNGNRESFYKSFATRDSIVLYSWTHYARKRRQISALLRHPDAAHLRKLVFYSPSETAAYVRGAERARRAAEGHARPNAR